MPGDRSWSTLTLEGPTWLLIVAPAISLVAVVVLTFVLARGG